MEHALYRGTIPTRTSFANWMRLLSAILNFGLSSRQRSKSFWASVSLP